MQKVLGTKTFEQKWRTYIPICPKCPTSKDVLVFTEQHSINRWSFEEKKKRGFISLETNCWVLLQICPRFPRIAHVLWSSGAWGSPGHAAHSSPDSRHSSGITASDKTGSHAEIHTVCKGWTAAKRQRKRSFGALCSYRSNILKISESLMYITTQAAFRFITPDDICLFCTLQKACLWH